MDRRILILITDIRGGWNGCISHDRCAVSLEMLVITFMQRVMTMFFHPQECFLSKVQRTSVVRSMVISSKGVNGKRIAVCIFWSHRIAFIISLAVNQAIETTICFVCLLYTSDAA